MYNATTFQYSSFENFEDFFYESSNVNFLTSNFDDFLGREIDEMEEEKKNESIENENPFEGYEDYYQDYQDLGEDYYLPQETVQVESERTIHKNPQRIRKEADEFNWYLHHSKKQ